jgi:hypothetical protein
VLVERLARHAGTLHDVGDGARAVAVLGDGLRHRVEQAPALGGEDDLARERMASSGQPSVGYHQVADEVAEA